MGIFKNLFGNWFDSDNNNNDGPEINPATGLPMIDNSGIDVSGNPFGTDFSTDNDNFNNSDINNDDFGNNDIFNDDGFNNSGLSDGNGFDSNSGDDDF